MKRAIVGIFAGLLLVAAAIAGDNFNVLDKLNISFSTATVTGQLAPANGGSGVANTKNLTWSNSLTLAGTDATTMTFPTTSGTVCASGNACTVTSLNLGGTTLSTYSEGTWTPSVGGTATYTVQDGTYIKIGKTVWARGSMTINAIGTGSTTIISGLPFTAVTTASGNPAGGGGIIYFSGLATAVVYLQPWVTSNATTVQFSSLTAAATTAANATVLFTAGTRVDFVVVYQAST